MYEINFHAKTLAMKWTTLESTYMTMR